MAIPAGFDHALDLFRRLRPLNVGSDLDQLCLMAPDMEDELRDRIDKPLTVLTCSRSGRDFLCCDYNRDGDFWRSPWSNELEPGPDGPPVAAADPGAAAPPGAALRPSDRVRKIEIAANDAFSLYRDHYLRAGLASVYLWDTDTDFAGSVLLKNAVGPAGTYAWDSIHGFTVSVAGTMAEYHLVSTVILTLCPTTPELGQFQLAGTLVREQTFTFPQFRTDDNHVANIGRIVESMENRMRGSIEDIYFGKALDITSNLRSLQSLKTVNDERAAHEEVIRSIHEHTGTAAPGSNE